MKPERHSETVIERHLLASGYVSASRDGFDRERAPFSDGVLVSVRDTQPAEWGAPASVHVAVLPRGALLTGRHAAVVAAPASRDIDGVKVVL